MGIPPSKNYAIDYGSERTSDRYLQRLWPGNRLHTLVFHDNAVKTVDKWALFSRLAPEIQSQRLFSCNYLNLLLFQLIQKWASFINCCNFLALCLFIQNFSTAFSQILWIMARLSSYPPWKNQISTTEVTEILDIISFFYKLDYSPLCALWLFFLP